MSEPLVGWGSRLIAFVLSPLLFPQSRVVLSHLPILPEAEHDWTGSIDGPDPLRLLVLGDSTAAGVGVESELDGLPGNLARAIHRRLGRGVQWTIIARSGATTGNVRQFFLGLATRSPYDLVFLSTGVNDVMQLRTAREFTADLAVIVEGLEKFNPRAPILLAGIPRMQRFDSLPDPLGVILGARAHRLNVAARHRVVEGHPLVVHVPPWPIATPGFFAEDNFHPGAPGYHAWAERSVAYWLDSMS